MKITTYSIEYQNKKGKNKGWEIIDLIYGTSKPSLEEVREWLKDANTKTYNFRIIENTRKVVETIV